MNPGAKKYEIQVAAGSDHLFMASFIYRDGGGGGVAPS